MYVIERKIPRTREDQTQVVIVIARPVGDVTNFFDEMVKQIVVPGTGLDQYAEEQQISGAQLLAAMSGG